MNLKRKIELYEKYSVKIKQELKRLDQWKEVLPIGQYPPSYERAWDKLLWFYKQKLMPIWMEIRHLICNNDKTLWQNFSWATTDQAPLFDEIKPFLKQNGEVESYKHRIHPEYLSTTITRFRNWIEIGYIIHVEADGSYKGIREVES